MRRRISSREDKWKGVKPKLYPRFGEGFRDDDHVFDLGIFRRDMSLAVAPILINDEKRYKGVEIKGDDAEKVKELLFDINGREWGRSDADLVFSVINSLSQYLIWSGESLFEICPTGKSDVPFILNSISSNVVYKTPFGYIQLVPKEMRQLDRDEKKIRICPAKDVWKIELPPNLGGVRELKNLQKKLRSFPTSFPPFSFEENLGFDLNRFNRGRWSFLLRATRKWGWFPHNLVRDYATEYYSMFRYLVSERTKASIRSHIIRQLNQLFARLKLDGRIDMGSALLSEEQIDKISESILSGNGDFAEILKRTRY